jgi:hypothetical protein
MILSFLGFDNRPDLKIFLFHIQAHTLSQTLSQNLLAKGSCPAQGVFAKGLILGIES